MGVETGVSWRRFRLGTVKVMRRRRFLASCEAVTFGAFHASPFYTS